MLALMIRALMNLALNRAIMAPGRRLQGNGHRPPKTRMLFSRGWGQEFMGAVSQAEVCLGGPCDPKDVFLCLSRERERERSLLAIKK
jgi:hypothetical protein